MNTKNKKIQVIHRKSSTIILSEENQFSFYKYPGGKIDALSSAPFTMPMLDDLEKSGIVEVESSNENGNITMHAKDSYSAEELVENLICIFEKYNL
jgi:hypothetical protein